MLYINKIRERNTVFNYNNRPNNDKETNEAEVGINQHTAK